METAWFMGDMELPPIDGCDPIPATGGLVDNGTPCFSAFGDTRYWREVSDAGEGGTLLWTNAFYGDMPSNWARFRLDVETAGTYAVEVSVDPAWGMFEATRYGIEHDGTQDSVIVDQGSSEGWVRLGVYDFAAGRGQHVSVYDNADHEVLPEQHIVVDAVRLVPVGPGTSSPGEGLPPGSRDGPDAAKSYRLTGGCSVGGRPPVVAWTLFLLLAWRSTRRVHRKW
jgi:hypothetical protein